jgi:hypothetical protein
MKADFSAAKGGAGGPPVSAFTSFFVCFVCLVVKLKA